MAHDFRDPADEYNGEVYQTGESCIEPGCERPAGTWWSQYWCVPCNIKRMERIGRSMDQIRRRLDDT